LFNHFVNSILVIWEPFFQLSSKFSLKILVHTLLILSTSNKD
jgi:hypothetical protein